MTSDLKSIGMDFPAWQDAVEAAISSNQLAVTGEVGDGQLVQFTDASGAQINILAAEPFSTYAGFLSPLVARGHVTMVNEVLGLVEVLDDNDETITTLSANIAQGPLLVEEGQQRFQELSITALGISLAGFSDPDSYIASSSGLKLGEVVSHGAAVIAANDGSTRPDSAAQIAFQVSHSEHRTNALTGQRFIYVRVSSPFPMDLCLPADSDLPAPGSVIAGRVSLTASILAPSGGGCGSGSGGCGCGGCGCGGH
ncbi:hypothetical protein [Corynebacterium ciconiae]|uniref:hypothetical protein n=1 Tax=Corynebacterium ciconiae TaxID=227319 RepID=UPI00037DB3EB|nr:hypothetical protein [Corynebacterium ciconiae]